MHIRKEKVQDIAKISNITTIAFSLAEYSNQAEAVIIERLRETGALSISLVAVEGEELVGHVAFSPVKIDGENVGWFGLGPVAVLPQYQNKEIGSMLIRKGLSNLTEQGANGCVVFGEPEYYKRFGFENDKLLYYQPAPPQYFLRLVLNGAAASGSVAYHKSFDAV